MTTKDTYTMHFQITMAQRWALFCLWFWSGHPRTAVICVSKFKVKTLSLCICLWEGGNQCQDLCLCHGVVEARNFTTLPVLQPLIHLHLRSIRSSGRGVLRLEVSEWLPMGQPDAIKLCYFPIHVYKMVYLYLNLEHKLVLCFTHPLESHAESGWSLVLLNYLQTKRFESHWFKAVNHRTSLCKVYSSFVCSLPVCLLNLGSEYCYYLTT